MHGETVKLVVSSFIWSVVWLDDDDIDTGYSH